MSDNPDPPLFPVWLTEDELEACVSLVYEHGAPGSLPDPLLAKLRAALAAPTDLGEAAMRERWVSAAIDAHSRWVKSVCQYTQPTYPHRQCISHHKGEWPRKHRDLSGVFAIEYEDGRVEKP